MKGAFHKSVCMLQIFPQSTLLEDLISDFWLHANRQSLNAGWVPYLICIVRLCRRKVAIFKLCEPIVRPITEVKCKLPWFLVWSCWICYICTVALHLDDQHSSTSLLTRIVLNVKGFFITIHEHAHAGIPKKLYHAANHKKRKPKFAVMAKSLE